MSTVFGGDGRMFIPEYTLSLLIWIVPIGAMSVFFIRKRLLSPEKILALAITIALLAAIGCVLDLLFAHSFFTFPDHDKTIGIYIFGIPVEEFVFYITGFWFVLFVYVFCDEFWLARYNIPDKRYLRYRSRLRRTLFLNPAGFVSGFVLICAGCAIKLAINPEGMPLPGYFVFLVFMAYTPMILFHRTARNFVNWPAYSVCVILTLLISVIWEVTLALPRGYWGYRRGAMLGLYIGVWNDLPIEAITVWIFCSLVVLVYEYLKIVFFTPHSNVPGYRLLSKVGKSPKEGHKRA